MRTIARKRKQGGSTLLEALAAMSILSGVMAGAAQLSDSYLTDTQAMTAAQQTRTFGEAARAYIQANQGIVAANATATAPCLIRASELTAYIPGITGTNTYGHNLGVLVLEPSANNLQGLVVRRLMMATFPRLRTLSVLSRAVSTRPTPT